MSMPQASFLFVANRQRLAFGVETQRGQHKMPFCQPLHCWCWFDSIGYRQRVDVSPTATQTMSKRSNATLPLK